MAGVAALGPDRVTFHRASALDQWDGRFFSSAEPLKDGPRHCGQSSARAEPRSAKNIRNKNNRVGFMAAGVIDCYLQSNSNFRARKHYL